MNIFLFSNIFSKKIYRLINFIFNHFQEKNPITGVKEPSFPQSIRYKRIAAGTGLILIMVTFYKLSKVYYKQSKLKTKVFDLAILNIVLFLEMNCKVNCISYNYLKLYLIRCIID